MLGYQSLVITMAVQSTSTGFNSGVWSWSTDDITFTPLAGVNDASNTSFSIKTADFSGATGINNASTVYLEYTLSRERHQPPEITALITFNLTLHP